MPVYYDNMDLSANEKQRFAICAIALGMTTGLLFYDSPAAGVLLTLCCGFYLPVYKRNLTEKKKSQLLLQFRDLLYSISSSVSAGRTVAQALEESVDFWKATYEEKDYIMQELAYMNGHIQKGGEKDIDVLKDFAKRSGLEDISDFVSVYESCRMTGGNLVQGINRATTIIGDKITLERELKTLMAQKIFESRIVALAPFAMVLFLRIMSPEYLEPLTTTQGGRIITTFALGLMAVSLVMMERINKIEI